MKHDLYFVKQTKRPKTKHTVLVCDLHNRISDHCRNSKITHNPLNVRYIRMQAFFSTIIATYISIWNTKEKQFIVYNIITKEAFYWLSNKVNVINKRPRSHIAHQLWSYQHCSIEIHVYRGIQNILTSKYSGSCIILKNIFIFLSKYFYV